MCSFFRQVNHVSDLEVFLGYKQFKKTHKGIPRCGTRVSFWFNGAVHMRLHYHVDF